MATRNIFVPKNAVGRLQEMANCSDIFRNNNRPVVHADQAEPLNELKVSVPCEGTKGVLDRLEIYALGLSDGLLYCR